MKRFANPHCCGVPYVTLAPRLTSLLEGRLSVSSSFTAFTPKELWKPTRDSYLENIFNRFELYQLLLFYTFSRQTNHA